MKKSVILVLILTLFFVWIYLSCQAFAQTRARTETGKEVILYPDGTWKYVTEPTVRPFPKVSYIKPPSATKFIKTERGNFGVWYDESKWKKAGKPDAEGKVHFQLIGEDGYVMVIAEGIEMPITTLKEVVLENAQKAAEDAKIILEEKRVVNGREILCLRINGTLKQIPFAYYGYYYGGKEGTIQVITYTSQNLLKKYEQVFTEFLNGLVISP